MTVLNIVLSVVDIVLALAIIILFTLLTRGMEDDNQNAVGGALL